MKNMNWQTVASLAVMCAFVLALVKLGVITNVGAVMTLMAGLVGSAMKPLFGDTTSGGSSLVPPPADVPPVLVPPSDAPKGEP